MALESQSGDALVAQRLTEHLRMAENLTSLIPLLVSFSQAVVTALRGGGTVYFFGNGGSAADSQHLAAELVNRFLMDRKALAAVALTTDSSVLTCIGNDSSFVDIFSRQLEAIGKPGDVAIGITTSGNSPNVVAGLRTARHRGLLTAAFTGASGGQVLDFADYCLRVPSRETPRIQEGHLFLGHSLCELIEHELSGTAPQNVISHNLPDRYVHPSAFVDAGVEIGIGTRVWHFSHIQKGAKIGHHCVLGQNVNIDRNVTIGNGVKIQNNVSVYNGVEIADDVFLGPSMVFTNVVNPRSHVSRKDEFRATRIEKGVTVGANATIVCGHTIGAYAFIGAGTVVTKDVPAYALVVGNPGKIAGWMCQCGVKVSPTHGDKSAELLVCRSCGASYRFSEGQLQPSH